MTVEVAKEAKGLALTSAKGMVSLVTLEHPDHLKRFESLLPRKSEALRWVRMAMVSITQGPVELRSCTYESIYSSMLQCAEAGLELGTPLKHAWLVPYFSKKSGKHEAQLVVGYMGYLALCYQSPKVLDVSAELVYEKEAHDFIYQREPEPVFRHKPYLGLDDPGQVIAAYAVAALKGGYHKLVLMTRFELNKFAAGKTFGPWKDYPGEMMKKTVIRRMVKTLSKTSRLSRAVEADFDYSGIDEPQGKGELTIGTRGVAGVKERLSARVVDAEPPMGMATGDPGHVPDAG